MADPEIEEIDAESALPVPEAPAQHNNGVGDTPLVPTNFTSLLPFVAFVQTPTHWQNSEEIADKLQKTKNIGAAARYFKERCGQFEKLPRHGPDLLILTCLT